MCPSSERLDPLLHNTLHTHSHPCSSKVAIIQTEFDAKDTQTFNLAAFLTRVPATCELCLSDNGQRRCCVWQSSVYWLSDISKYDAAALCLHHAATSTP
jgi:hypothetical protein